MNYPSHGLKPISLSLSLSLSRSRTLSPPKKKFFKPQRTVQKNSLILTARNQNMAVWLVLSTTFRCQPKQYIFASFFLLLFHFYKFHEQNVRREYFDQNFQCAVPKCLSKFTNLTHNLKEQLFPTSPLSF